MERDKEIQNSLAARILGANRLTADEIEWMAEKQRYLRDPRLALAYYYCCGADPDSFVYGDEQIRGEKGAEARARISKLLDDYPKKADIAECQREVLEGSSESTTIWACASCGRILLQNKREKVFFSTLEDLQSVQLSGEEREDILVKNPDPIACAYRQLYFHRRDVYFLIPELVCDHERIPLCQACHSNPRKSKFSVASGHDYGRVGQLPDLNDTALSCISPARCFGLEISLSGKHSRGHAICFPSNGPCELARVLPRVDDGCIPRVTFIGPLETWRVQQGKVSKLYTIPVDDVYKWLSVLAAINNVFDEVGIKIEDTPRRRQLLGEMELVIQNGVQVSNSAAAESLDEAAESFGLDSEGGLAEHLDGSSSEVLLRSSAVLSHVEESDSTVAHEIIDAMIGAVGVAVPVPEGPTIPIKRGRSPYVEWIENAKLLASVFPNLFLMGSEPLPSGPLPADYVDHLMHYWDGRFERSVTFTTMLFNQLQRHAAVQKAARVGITHGKTTEKFGRLISTEKFRKALEFAKSHPDSTDAVKLNAGLLRLLSLVGGNVPFSPFERATTRPKLGAMRFRYGIALHWVTMAPPEHDDLLLHRLAEMRRLGCWNDPSSVYVQKECRFKDLPKEILSDARKRLKVSSMYPALSAQVFERRLKSLTNDIIRCRDSRATRASSNYLAYECGVYGRCAAFNAVVEPQVDGRLHAHMTVYGSSMNPSLLARLSCCSELQSKTREYLDAISCTVTTDDARSWCEAWREGPGHGAKMPRAFEIEVPDADSDFGGFLRVAEQRAIATNIHSLSTTCRKGSRGRLVCRLSRPAGIHKADTQPLCIRLKAPTVLGKRQRASFAVMSVTGTIADAIDSKLNYANKRIIREHMNGAIIWEQHRPDKDSMFVETNLSLACLTSSHTNSAVMNGEDAGDMVEEYQQAYMTKEKGGLKFAAAAMHTAVGHILKYPSVAEDSGTNLRSAKHLATRTINAFSGGNEWSHSLMAYALAGHRSYLSSDTFWFVFPQKLVQYIEDEVCDAALPAEDGAMDIQDAGDTGESTVHSEFDELIATVDADDVASNSATNTGARMYRLDDGTMILVTQAESYRHRGPWFQDYSPLEFEMIVDILPRSTNEERTPSQRGRPKRRGFDLAQGHPLANHCQGFIRAKFKTPMLGGAPTPCILKNGQPSSALSKYLLCLLTPWNNNDSAPWLDLSPRRLIELCKEWNSASANFVNRQRYQYLHNTLKKRSRSSTNEKACSEWRSRNADFWNENSPAATSGPTPTSPRDGADSSELDRNGLLSVGSAELFELIVGATAKSRVTTAAVKALKKDFWSLVPASVGSVNTSGPKHDPVFKRRSGDLSLSAIARSIHAMRPLVDTEPPPEKHDETISDAGGDVDALRSTREDEAARVACTPDQRAVFDMILQSIGGSGVLRQTLTLLHGGGGTGKSTLIRRIVSSLKRHGIKTVNTCPTGVGASHLQNGRTFHSAFKTIRDTLSVNDLALLRLSFTDRVWLIVVDKVSMLSAAYLVLLDVRLREIYQTNVPFGGRSVLLCGDFLQLKVLSGIALCKALYMNTRSRTLSCARALFSRFKAFFLTHQHRAASCPIQQANLEACRVLPTVRPTGDSWTILEKQAFRPVSDQVVESLTTQLDATTISQDPGWLDDMTILVTSNFDKAVLKSCTARLYAKRNNLLLFRWRRDLKRDISPEFESIVLRRRCKP